MDHAAAHERIEDLVLEPARLAALAGSTDPADVALREHVAGCAVCGADLEGWQGLQRRLAVALPGSVDAATAVVEPIGVPPSLRAAVVAAVRDADRAPASTSIVQARRRPPIVGWLAVAAAIVVLAGSVAITIDQIGQRGAAEARAAGLSNAIAAVDRVLVAPEHRVVGLKDGAGAAGGTISWSGQDLVVLTTALEPPPTGQRYLCWLVEGDGSASLIGQMYFAGRTAYWVGSLDEWATFRIGPNTRFVVTLPQPGVTRFSGPVYLSADLGADRP
ncbi:MAG: anti-sigma factor [Chloroflexi bacterium]|nr:anti-sigma factor [Chloroflexota bacterium]